MKIDLAKRNRLNGKFSFKLRDWREELDVGDEFPRFVPLKSAGARKFRASRSLDHSRHRGLDRDERTAS